MKKGDVLLDTTGGGGCRLLGGLAGELLTRGLATCRLASGLLEKTRREVQVSDAFFSLGHDDDDEELTLVRAIAE